LLLLLVWRFCRCSLGGGGRFRDDGGRGLGTLKGGKLRAADEGQKKRYGSNGHGALARGSRNAGEPRWRN
jgi:hypothetical protein